MSSQAEYLRHRRDSATMRAQHRAAQKAYRTRKRERRSPDRRDVAEAALRILAHAPNRLPVARYIVDNLVKAGYDKIETQDVVAVLLRIASCDDDDEAYERDFRARVAAARAVQS